VNKDGKERLVAAGFSIFSSGSALAYSALGSDAYFSVDGGGVWKEGVGDAIVQAQEQGAKVNNTFYVAGKNLEKGTFVTKVTLWHSREISAIAAEPIAKSWVYNDVIKTNEVFGLQMVGDELYIGGFFVHTPNAFNINSIGVYDAKKDAFKPLRSGRNAGVTDKNGAGTVRALLAVSSFELQIH
jgi:hypothetical protein